MPTWLSRYRRQSTRLLICAILSFGAALPGLARIAETTTSSAIGFSSPVSYPVGAAPEVVLVADFNNDNKLDLVTANYDSDNVSMLLGRGDGTFQPVGAYPVVCFSPQSLVSGDFNGDGKRDLATVDGRCGNGSVLLNNGSGFQPATPYNTLGCPSWVVSGDFNLDGKLDLAVVNGEICLARPVKGDSKAAPTIVGPGISIAMGNGNGTFQGPVNYLLGSGPTRATVGDFNHDGKLDLAVATASNGSVSILLGNGNGSFQNGGSYAAGAHPYSITTADFNNDGKFDLAVANSSANVSVLINNGNGTFQSPINCATGATSSSVTARDFNGDGNIDLVTANPDSNNVSVMLGNGDATFQPAATFAAGTYPKFVATGDFKGNGQIDLVTVNTRSNSVSVMLNCAGSMSVAATSQFFTMNGGEGNVQMLAPNGCGWTAASNNNWITLTSADSGNGNDTVTFEVRENFTGSARQGSLLIGGSTVTVIQDAGLGDDCDYSISPPFQSFPASGGASAVNVAAAERCAWQATSNVDWVTFTADNIGIGDGAMSYAVAANPSATGRKGIITIAGKTFTVKQKGN